MKEAAYKGMVHPILEYGSLVWDPHPDKLQKELEKVQNRAARFVTRNYVSFFLSLYTATRPHGHSRQVGAASVSIRQKKLKYSKE